MPSNQVARWLRLRGGPSSYAARNCAAWLSAHGHRVSPRTLERWAGGKRWPPPPCILDMIELDLAGANVTSQG